MIDMEKKRKSGTVHPGQYIDLSILSSGIT